MNTERTTQSEGEIIAALAWAVATPQEKRIIGIGMTPVSLIERCPEAQQFVQRKDGSRWFAVGLMGIAKRNGGLRV